MNEAFILDAVHTPRGRRGGALSSVHPVELMATPLRALVARSAAHSDALYILSPIVSV